jgi:hypothetical protein
MEEEFFREPETEIILKLMSGKSVDVASNEGVVTIFFFGDSRSQIPFFVEGERFNLSMIYQWIYIWGRTFPRLAEDLKVPEGALFEAIKEFVENVKKKLDINPENQLEEVSKTSALAVVSQPQPHTLIAHPPLLGGLNQWSESFPGG